MSQWRLLHTLEAARSPYVARNRKLLNRMGEQMPLTALKRMLK
jgi:hypothetical protein